MMRYPVDKNEYDTYKGNSTWDAFGNNNNNNYNNNNYYLLLLFFFLNSFSL